MLEIDTKESGDISGKPTMQIVLEEDA